MATTKTLSEPKTFLKLVGSKIYLITEIERPFIQNGFQLQALTQIVA
jgi:hypothetical protein